MAAVVVVTQNTYNLWQTVLALVLITGALARWLNSRLPRKSEMDDLKRALRDAKESNSAENSRIMALVREVKFDLRQTTARLERHIDKVKENPAEIGDE